MPSDTYLFIRALKKDLDVLRNRLEVLETATVNNPITYVTTSTLLANGVLITAGSTTVFNPITTVGIPATARSVLLTGRALSAGAGYLYFDKQAPTSFSTYHYWPSGTTLSFQLLVPIAADGSLHVQAVSNNMTVTLQVNGYAY